MKTPTPQQITKWLDETGRSRSDLASQLNVSSETVKGWLSANRPITGAALQLLQLLMKPAPVINPQFTLEEWLKIESLAKADGLNARDWINQVLKREISLADLPKPQAPTVKTGPTKPTKPTNIHNINHPLAADQAADNSDLSPPVRVRYPSGKTQSKKEA
jgi:hypothetical protein